MYNALLHSHSGLRWVVLILLIINILNAYRAKSGTGLTATDKKMSLFGLIATHVQFIIGLVLYWKSPKVHFGEGMMSNDSFRFFTMEHSVLMLVAIVLITLGNRDAKTGNAKKMFWKLFFALILMLLGIPWPFREALGGSWF